MSRARNDNELRVRYRVVKLLRDAQRGPRVGVTPDQQGRNSYLRQQIRCVRCRRLRHEPKADGVEVGHDGGPLFLLLLGRGPAMNARKVFRYELLGRQ
jgi:hypothetical protein